MQLFFVAANSTFFKPFNWYLKWPFWSYFLTEGVVFHEELGNVKKPKPKSMRVMSLLELLLKTKFYQHQLKKFFF